MKNQLLRLYKDRQNDFKSILGKFPNACLNGPFLMSPDKIYTDQKRRLLIIGKETNGWPVEGENLDKQMKQYGKFNVGLGYYSSPFWSVTRKLEELLGNKSHSCAWSNLSKFDLDCGSPYGEYEDAVSTVDDILKEEIEIIDPLICIFFTGPSLDDRIKDVFTDVKFEKCGEWNERALSKLVHPNLPTKTYRVYHPNYLRRAGFEDDFLEFMSSI
jgi:hypothetical protein